MLGTDARGFRSGGNGQLTACAWCGCLVGERAGWIAVRDRAGRPRRLPVLRMEQDRILPRLSYSVRNCLPACGPCNRARGFEQAAAAGAPEVEDCILVRGY